MIEKRRRAARGSGEQLRVEILDATEELLVELGDEHAVSIRSVADAVGVTPPSIYLHFADKEKLMLAVCERQFERLATALAAAASRANDPLDELRLRGKAYVTFGLEHPDAYRIMFMGRSMKIDDDPAMATMTPAFAGMVDNVQRAIAAGTLRSQLDPMQTAVILWTNVHGVTSLLISKPEFPWPDREKLIDEVLESAVRGLRKDS